MKNLPFGLGQQSDAFPSVVAEDRHQSARLPPARARAQCRGARPDCRVPPKAKGPGLLQDWVFARKAATPLCSSTHVYFEAILEWAF